MKNTFECNRNGYCSVKCIKHSEKLDISHFNFNSWQVSNYFSNKSTIKTLICMTSQPQRIFHRTEEVVRCLVKDPSQTIFKQYLYQTQTSWGNKRWRKCPLMENTWRTQMSQWWHLLFVKVTTEDRTWKVNLFFCCQSLRWCCSDVCRSAQVYCGHKIWSSPPGMKWINVKSVTLWETCKLVLVKHNTSVSVDCLWQNTSLTFVII